MTPQNEAAALTCELVEDVLWDIASVFSEELKLRLAVGIVDEVAGEDVAALVEKVVSKEWPPRPVGKDNGLEFWVDGDGVCGQEGSRGSGDKTSAISQDHVSVFEETL